MEQLASPTTEEQKEATDPRAEPEKRVIAKLVHQPSPNANPFERRVFKLLKSFYNEGLICELGGGQGNTLEIHQQVDASFRFLNNSQDYFFIIECKDVEDPSSLKLKPAVEQLKIRLDLVESTYKPKYCPGAQVKVLLAVNVTPDQLHEAPDSVITLMNPQPPYLTKDHLDYYEGLTQTYGAKYTFPVFLLEIFGIKVEFGSPLNVPALRTERLGKVLYTFQMSAADLLNLSYVHRATSFAIQTEAYQRMLNPNRLKEIAKELDKRRFDVNFPNNLIANLHSIEASFVADPTDPEKGSLELKNRYESIRIVDGQHRLYSFLHVKDQKLKGEFQFIVTGFVDLSQDEQSRIFASINYNAKRVTPDLIDYLFSLETQRGKIGHAAIVCRLLADQDGAFDKDRLYLGYEKSRKGRYLGLHAIVRILTDEKQYRLITDKVGRIQKDENDEDNPRRILKDYFESMRKNFKHDWNKRRDGFTKTSNGIAVFLGLLSKIADREDLDDLNVKTFDKYFKRLHRTRWANYRDRGLTSEKDRREAINELAKRMKL